MATPSSPLAKLNVQDRVAQLQAARVQRLKVTQDQVVREFAKLAFVNMQDFITVQADGSAYTDLSKLTRDQAVAIQEITADQYTESRGDAARNVRRLKIKLADKQGAEPRELLMPPTEASVDWYTPEVLAQKLLIFTGGNFSEAEMLPYAHAMMDFPDGDRGGIIRPGTFHRETQLGPIFDDDGSVSHGSRITPSGDINAPIHPPPFSL